jgi:hypothetical protein
VPDADDGDAVLDAAKEIAVEGIAHGAGDA